MTLAAQLAGRADSLSVGGTYDFSALDAFVAPAKVVLLGEQDHGDGAAFGFKAALVRYLHLTHGAFVMSGVTHNNPSAQPWADAYDGLIFIRTMHGLTR